MLGWRTIAAMGLVLGALSGAVAAYETTGPSVGGGHGAHWQEIAWPFPRDGWPPGRAFRCDASSCGDAVELYVRPKIGFCNCDTGVADDDEVDRVADLDLMSERFEPLEPGNVVRVAEMSGRSRSYELTMSNGSRHAAVGIAVSHRCDLLVAVTQGSGGAPELKRAALEFLASREMTHWMMAALDGR